MGGGQSAAANTPFAQPISVQSVDQYGNGVAGVAVVVTGPAAGAGATFSPPPASDAQGFTTFTVTANTVTGAYTVTLTAGGVAQTISLANSAGPPAAVTVVAGGGQSIVAGGAFGAITLSIADGFNNPVGGTGVTLTSTPAGVTLPTGLTTAADGTLTFTPTAAGVAGAFTVVATAGGVSVSLTSTVTVGPPAGLLLSGGRDQTAVVGAGFALPIRVLIADAFNNPVAGQPVTVTGPTTGAGGAFSNPGSTDVLGFVSFTATANTVAGSYTIIVSSGSLTLLVKLTNKAASAAVVTVVSGDGQAIVVGSPATLALVYTVTDSFGNAVDPRGATFVSPPSGPAATVGPVALTGVPGQGRVTVAANSTVGNYTITLNAGSATIRLSFSNVPVPVVPPPPATPPVVPPPAPPAPPAPPDVPPVAPALVQALQGTPQFAVGTGDGGTPEVRVYGPGGKLLASFLAFDASTPGGSRAAAADFSNSGRFDIVAGTGPGTPNRVRVLDGATGAVKADFQPFEETFTGGLFVTLGDLNGDGVPDLVVTPDQSGGPIVVVYDGAALSRGQVAQLNRFFGIEDPDFRGGARAAVGLVSGKPQVVVSAGFGGGPRIAVFDGRDVAAGAARPAHTVPDFFAFEAGLRNGAYVAAGDVAGTGSTNFIFGAGPGGGPRVRVLDAAKLVAAGGTYSTLDELPAAQVANFFAGDAGSRGGVRVAVKRLDATGQAGLVVGAGSGAGSRVTGYTGATLVTSASPAPLFSFDDAADFAGGVFVG